ncbi:hypothetical protein WKI71_44355 [Streptomyces sp. MS1.AVA.1]|uniref:Uncharacterized protein n=1 Tax=Streptomyces machairae TaxID=3134109 RepID=A0ABU8UWW4_9ACTN
MTQHNPHSVPVEPGVFVPVGVRAWQDGYDEGISSPPDVPRTPLVRDPDYAEAWAQGALAGNADGRTEGWRWAYFEGKVRPEPKDEAVGRYGPQDSGEPGLFAQSWPCVGERPLLVMLAQFAPGERGGDGLTGRLLAQACTDKGVRQLYVPVNLSSSPPVEEPTGDALHDAGYWHGTVCESLEEAGPEAIAQVTVRVPNFAGIVRYAPAAEHNFFDLLPVDGRLQPGR